MARKYEKEYKVRAVKLAKEIGGSKEAKELGVPEGTIHTWLKVARSGSLDIGEGPHTPCSAMSLAEEITALRKPNGITKADREARKSDDLLKRDFSADKPLEKCVTDIIQIKARDGKFYVSAIFDCFDSCGLGLAMGTDMKAFLCVRTLDSAMAKYDIQQSMNSAGDRCHDNARKVPE